ncbi:IS3 family transposase, partial [Enterococcus faecium]|nr:IS3 family transposase [Enterococcus faecium]MDO8008518.1 IS3 family transposase [Enterococcus faecium]
WVKKLDKPDKYSKIKQEITAIVKESRNSYGYRRVTLALKMKGRKIYLSPILDLFNGEIISYSISTSPTYKLIEEMLQQAIKK